MRRPFIAIGLLIASATAFGDTIAIGRVRRKHIYHMDRLPKQPPLVRAELRFEVAERVDHTRGVVSANEAAIPAPMMARSYFWVAVSVINRISFTFSFRLSNVISSHSTISEIYHEKHEARQFDSCLLFEVFLWSRPSEARLP